LHDAGYGYCDNVTLVSDRDDDPAWNDNFEDGSKRRNEDGDSWERSDNQEGEQDKDNWKTHVFVDFQYRKRNCICMTKHKILILCTVCHIKYKTSVIHNRLLQWSRIIFEMLILFQFYDMPFCIAHYTVFIETLNRIRYGIRYVSHDCLNLQFKIIINHTLCPAQNILSCMVQVMVMHIACDSFVLVPNRKEDRNKRRNEDDGGDRSHNQKGRQYDNWRGQDRGMGAEKYSRNAGGGGRKLFSV